MSLRSRKRIIESEDDLFSHWESKSEDAFMKRRSYISFDEEKDYNILKVQN